MLVFARLTKGSSVAAADAAVHAPFSLAFSQSASCSRIRMGKLRNNTKKPRRDRRPVRFIPGGVRQQSADRIEVRMFAALTLNHVVRVSASVVDGRLVCARLQERVYGGQDAHLRRQMKRGCFRRKPAAR